MLVESNGMITIFSKRIYEEDIFNLDYLHKLTLNENRAIIKEYMLLYRIDELFTLMNDVKLSKEDKIVKQKEFINKHNFIKSPKSKINFDALLEKKDLISLMRYTVDISFNLGNYIESTVYSEACARKSADAELRKVETDKVKENIKAIKKKIKSCKSELTQFTNIRSAVVMLQKYIKEGKKLPKSLKLDNKNLKIEFNKNDNKFMYKEEIYTPHVFFHRVLNPTINRLRSNLGNLNSKLYNLNVKLEKYKSTKPTPVMFGTKKFFKYQFTKDEYKGNRPTKHKIRHSRWLEEFRYKRNNKFTVQGLKTSKNCNFVFSYTREAEIESDIIQGPIPCEYNFLLKHKEKEIIFRNVDFPYGKEMLLEALNRENREPVKYSVENHKGYYIIKASFKPVASTYNTITSLKHGILAFDINYGFLAYAVINKCGNFIKHGTIPFNPGNVKSIELAMVKIVNLAKYFNVPIGMEDLDLNNKIYSTKYGPKKRKRMLNLMCVTQINNAILSRANKLGIAVYKTNPAYTSLLSKVYTMGTYGLSVHEGAAVRIGRRILGFKETLPVDYWNILKDIDKEDKLKKLNSVLSKFNNKVFYSKELRGKLKFIGNLNGLESLLKELSIA